MTQKENLRHITLRIPQNIYDKLVQLTVKRTQIEGKIITLSKIIREVIEKGIKL